MMRQLTPDEAKKIQVELLDVIAAFCDERGINYFLDSGTLLGAVRHKGYIPWDDDIDIGMLRPDYDRFMREFNGYNPRYEFRCPEVDPSYPRPFGRVFDTYTVAEYADFVPGFEGQGVNVDIFVFDNAPDDDTIAARMYCLRDFYYKMLFGRIKCVLSPAEGNIVRRFCVRIFRIMMRVFPRNYFVKKLIENSKRYASAETKRVGDFTGYDYVLCNKEAFRSFIELEFEDKMYKVPIGYDELLTQHYGGDYTTPPPPEERYGHTPFIAYMKD